MNMSPEKGPRNQPGTNHCEQAQEILLGSEISGILGPKKMSPYT